MEGCFASPWQFADQYCRQLLVAIFIGGKEKKKVYAEVMGLCTASDSKSSLKIFICWTSNISSPVMEICHFALYK